MDAMRKNQGYAGECSIVDKEPNTCTISFLNFLNIPTDIMDECANYSKLSIVAQMFTIKSNHGLSETDYDRIVE